MVEISIRTVGGNGTFEDIIVESSDEMQEVARAIRLLIAEVMPGVTEVPWATQRTAGYGVGPKKMSDHFCYIAPHKKYVNLGFFYGAELPGPDGMLEGGGKLLRHIKIASLEDLQNPSLRQLPEVSSSHLPKLKNT